MILWHFFLFFFRYFSGRIRHTEFLFIAKKQNFSKYLTPLTEGHESIHHILTDLVREYVRNYLLSFDDVPKEVVIEREEMEARV